MDKKKNGGLSIIFVCMLVIICMALGGYFRFVSSMVYQESSQHLEEIYGQIAQSFEGIVEEKWKILDVWDQYLVDVDDDDEISRFISSQKEMWGFTDFYFIASDGSYLTLDGEKGYINLRDQMIHLVRDREPVVEDIAFPGKPELQVFANPSNGGSYKDFSYDVIAISYDNSALVNTLKVSAFDGKATSYVVSSSGRVLMDNVGDSERSIFNIFAYLEDCTDMTREQLESLKENLQNKESGITTFQAQGESYYLVYNAIGDIDNMVLGILPHKVVNASMNRLQTVTITVCISIAVAVGLVLILMLIQKNRKILQEKDLDILYREELFETISKNVNDVFLMMNSENFHLDYVSPNIEKILGIGEEEFQQYMYSMQSQNVQEDVLEIAEHLPQVERGETQNWECYYVHKPTGENKWFQNLIYRAVVLGEEKFIIVLSDHTKDSEKDQSLNDALELAKSANKAKSNFLANMSHDIRTPMNAIVGFATILERNVQNPDKVQEYTHKIVLSSRHLLGLINDILDMSKIESGQTTLNNVEFKLEELLEEIQSIVFALAKSRNQHFKIITKGAIPGCVQGDKVRLNQILLNLLSNAVKYTPEGGDITLMIEVLPQKIHNHANIRFTVTDNGYGMSSDFVDMIFEPFARENKDIIRETQGTGLGMAITKNIVDLMGGTIRVDSKPGKGSTFIVELEILMVDLELDTMEKYKEKQAEASLEGLHILAAEDNELNAEILQELLGMDGAFCDMTENGQEVLERFERSKPGEFDVIFMDIQMPVMNGYEAARKIRCCAHPDAGTIPIIAMTANAFDEDVQKALDAGMNAHMSKPVDMERIRKIVQKLLS